MNKLDLARRPMSAASLLTWGGGIVWRKLQIGSGSFRDLCKPAGTNEEDQLVNINKLMSMYVGYKKITCFRTDFSRTPGKAFAPDERQMNSYAEQFEIQRREK
eukprot:756461-Hanusia_phi.AAC.11